MLTTRILPKAGQFGTDYLTPEEEGALFATLRETGCRTTRDTIFRRFTPIARADAAYFRGSGLEHDDLLQEALMALTRAIDAFDPSLGHRFATLAKTYVRHALIRFSMDNVVPVRLGRNPRERQLYMHLQKAKKAWEMREMRRIDAVGHLEIAVEFGVPVTRVEAVLSLLEGTDVALESPDVAAAAAIEAASDEDQVVDRIVRQRVGTLYATVATTLDPRDRHVLERRLFGTSRATREAIGEDLGISKERVRQLEARAVGRVRRAFEAAGIRHLADVAPG